MGHSLTREYPVFRLIQRRKSHSTGELTYRVLTTHLLSVTKRHSVQHHIPTAVVTYNVRGIGGSHGSSAWITAGNDPEDYAAVQQWAVDILGGSEVVKEVKRMVCHPISGIHCWTDLVSAAWGSDAVAMSVHRESGALKG